MKDHDVTDLERLRRYVTAARVSEYADPRIVLLVVEKRLAELSQAGGSHTSGRSEQ